MSISRTHRPRKFRDVTGQQHVTETLRREVETGILGHAYLFSGPRGVGKTTTARIFANALLNGTTDKGEPPADSDISKEVEEGRCIDLIEIDAASHTGVENVREAIIEHVRFAPVRAKRKVYIIDECHMLSASAWNALLKTLEEPPAYAFFILATTELHKVPETIISRCQRFEFRRIASEALAERVSSLAKEEGIGIDDEVVRAIVHASDGCVRDAESLLDQLASLGSEKITREIASLVLPASRIPDAVRLVACCRERDPGKTLALARELVESGIPPADILENLLLVVRMLIRAEDPSERKRLAEGDAGDRAIAGIYGTVDRGEVGDLALALLERRRDVKSGTDPQFALELIVLAFAGSLFPHANAPAPVVARVSEPVRTAPAPKIETPTPPVQLKKDEVKTNPAEKSRVTSVESRGNPGGAGDREVRIEKPVTEGLPQAEPSAPVLDLNDLRMLWNAVIREVEKENRSLPFVLKVAKPISVNGAKVTIGFAYDFHREKIIEDLKIRGIVERAIASVMKCKDIVIEGVVVSQAAAEASSAPTTADIVSKVLSTFGGEVVG